MGDVFPSDWCFNPLGSEAKGGWDTEEVGLQRELVMMHLYSKPLTSLCDYILFDFSLARGGLYHRIITAHTT